MKKNVKITILKSEVNNELAKQYAIPNLWRDILNFPYFSRLTAS